MTGWKAGSSAPEIDAEAHAEIDTEIDAEIDTEIDVETYRPKRQRPDAP